MRKIVLLCLVISNTIYAQDLKLILSINDSCIEKYSQTNPLQIIMQNSSAKNLWVDLEGVNYEIYLDDSILKPSNSAGVGLLSPQEIISKNGFALCRKRSRDTLIIHTNMFSNYSLEVNSVYCLKGYYKETRFKLFKNVYKGNLNLSCCYFTICNE